jgi:hypothetical protein
MFWTDKGIVDKIERATLTGENRVTIVQAPAQIYDPTGITIDYTNHR